VHWLAALDTNIEATGLVFSFILSSSLPPQEGPQPTPSRSTSRSFSQLAHPRNCRSGGGGGGSGEEGAAAAAMAVGAVSARPFSPLLPLLPYAGALLLLFTLIPGPRHAACAVAKVLPCWVSVPVLFADAGCLVFALSGRSISLVLVLFRKWLCVFMSGLVVACVCVFWQIVGTLYIAHRLYSIPDIGACATLCDLLL
jgi:hypothetical protein